VRQLRPEAKAEAEHLERGMDPLVGMDEPGEERDHLEDPDALLQRRPHHPELEPMPTSNESLRAERVHSPHGGDRRE